MSNKHRDHIERRYHKLMDALRYVIHYNMPDDYIDNLICDVRAYEEFYHPTLGNGFMKDSPITWVLWQIIICMYGDYGTSPRSGWITDVAGAIKFLEELKGDRNNVE